MSENKRISTDGEPIVWNSPFAALASVKLGPAPDAPASKGRAAGTHLVKKKNRGRVDIIRQTAHRGGKTVTVVTGFTGIGQAEKEQLAREMQKACGVGGTVKEGRIEIQGDKREEVARILTHAGFRPVFAGG
jgi:translation initiation factor 1